MPVIRQAGLDKVQVEHFIQHGFLKLESAFSADTAMQAREILWSKIGLSPAKPAEWKDPVVRVPFLNDVAFVEAANTPRLHAAYDALAGESRWLQPTGLGTFPIRFSSQTVPTDIGWHVDASFGMENPNFMQWRVNVKSKGRALLMLFLLSNVGLEDGPTRIRSGSHMQIARELLPRGEEGSTLAELAADGFASTADCEEVFATGSAGTVYLCHPFLVHAAQQNKGLRPRFMAQPALLPSREFDPALPPSPVQLAIREACGLKL